MASENAAPGLRTSTRYTAPPSSSTGSRPSSRATASTLVTHVQDEDERGDPDEQRDTGPRSGGRLSRGVGGTHDPIIPHRDYRPDSPCQRASRPARSTARIRRSVASRAAAVVTTRI